MEMRPFLAHSCSSPPAPATPVPCTSRTTPVVKVMLAGEVKLGPPKATQGCCVVGVGHQTLQGVVTALPGAEAWREKEGAGRGRYPSAALEAAYCPLLPLSEQVSPRGLNQPHSPPRAVTLTS